MQPAQHPLQPIDNLLLYLDSSSGHRTFPMLSKRTIWLKTTDYKARHLGVISEHADVWTSMHLRHLKIDVVRQAGANAFRVACAQLGQ